MKLKGKVAIITGASKGIGKAIAETFAKEGCSLTIASRNFDEISGVAKDLKNHSDVLPVKCDVANPADVEAMIKKTIEHFKKIDILVNNAGIYGPIGCFVENDIELWKKTIDINLIGTAICTKSVLPHMIKAKRGKIINLSGGGSGGLPQSTISAYVTSKMAVVRFTEVIADEVKEHNIQVNSIAPGAVNTRLLDQILAAGEKVDKKFLERSAKQLETGGTPPEKAAQLSLFLVSEESDGITGKLLSAVWDDYQSFPRKLHEVRDTQIYTVKRIDEVKYKEVKK
jgi:3-oxoacyl-[acyl-carrier protein] reductase